MKETADITAALDKLRREGRLTERGGPAPEPLPERSMDEKTFMHRVIRLAEEAGYRYYHVHYSQNSNAGFPDLVLWRDSPPTRAIYVECKTEKGKLSAAQTECIASLRAAGDTVYVWRPSMMDEIKEVLK